MKKKYFYFLIGLILIDIFFSLLFNADLLDRQKELVQLQKRVNELQAENERLKREVAQLSSLTRIAKQASGMGLTRNNQRIIVIGQNQFAMR